jgi:hypothetical protein
MQAAAGAGPGQDGARPSEIVPAETRRPNSVRDARQHGYA